MQPPPQKKQIALIVLCTTLFIISVSDTVLNLTLPDISGSLGATATELLWIVDVYLLVVATLQITFGSIGDRYGRKRLLQIGLIAFGVGSLGAAFSTSATMLILFRIVTALGAAIMMPSTMSILTDIFREPKERAKAIAVWSSVFSIGAGLGPIIAGYLLQCFSWSSVFYLNIPIVIAGLIGSYLYLPESCGNNDAKLNPLSICLSAAGLVALVYAIITAGESGWLSTQVLVSFVAAAVMLAGFVLWERKTVSNLLPLEFFKNMSFTGSAVAVTLSCFALMGSLYFFSIYFQSVQNYTPLETGLCMLPLNVFVFIFTLLSVRVDQKIGTKLTVSLGLVATAFGLLLFGFTASITTPYSISLLVQLLISIGLGLVMSPATNAIMNSIPSSRAGVGSAMNDTTRQIGGALGIAVLGSLVNAVYVLKINASALINTLPQQTGDLIRRSLQSAQIAATQLPENTAAEVLTCAKQSFLDGLYQSVMVGAAILFLAAALTMVLLPKRTKHYDAPQQV
jgi:EmrB/QacA subfamily drug resistance transporter